MRQKSNNLSIIIPIFNEKKIIEKFLLSLLKSFKKINCKFIFIDDGSYDGSIEKTEKILKTNFFEENYIYKKLNKNHGKAKAVKEGINFIDSDYTLLIDSDLEYSAEDAKELYQIALKNKSIDVIQGSRYLGAKLQARKYILNDIAVRINTLIFNFLFSQSITDLHTGTKVIKSKLLKSLDLNYPRFGLEININSQIAKKNKYIYEYGISYVERSKEDGKKITLLDGILSYYYLFISRFIQNNFETKISIFYSFIIMTLIGSQFGTGILNIIITIIFSFTGLMIALNRKIIALTFIFSCIYLGSILLNDNGKIISILILFIFSLYISKKINSMFSINKKNKLFKLLF